MPPLFSLFQRRKRLRKALSISPRALFFRPPSPQRSNQANNNKKKDEQTNNSQQHLTAALVVRADPECSVSTKSSSEMQSESVEIKGKIERSIIIWKTRLTINCIELLNRLAQTAAPSTK